MKKNITLYLFSFTILFFYSTSIVNAQNFLWGKRGGSSESTQGSDDETVKDLAVDRNGNIYVLSQVMTPGLNVDGLALTGYGANDIMLASFRPNGQLRWIKVIGSSRASENGHWLGTDGKDGIYFVGNVYKDNGPVNIDKDATSPKNWQTNIIVKYDTAGVFQWYRHPEMDTFSTSVLWGDTRTIAMDVGQSGTVYWLMQLCPGGYGNGALKVTDTGTYLIKYSSSGTFSYFKPDVSIKGAVIGATSMTVDEANGRFFLAGSTNGSGLKIGGTDITSTMFLGCFKLDGSVMWEKHNNAGKGAFFSRSVVDVAGNIYLAGWAHSTGAIGPAVEFNGYTVTTGNGRSTPFIVKMDKNGNNVWAREANVTASCAATTIALRNNSEVVIAGHFVGLLEWPNYFNKFQTQSGATYDMFITRFNTANGDVVGIDKLNSNSSATELANRMASDNKSHIYIGGKFNGSLFVDNKDTLINIGNQYDWFLVKYGDMWPASVQDHNTKNNVRIYPNPANEQIIIEGIAEGTTIHVMNMLGQQVLQTISKTEKEAISTSYLTPGNYILQLTNNDGSKESYRIEKR